jgi:hypothetical protein
LFSNELVAEGPATARRGRNGRKAAPSWYWPKGE